jgi:hypothetical protein
VIWLGNPKLTGGSISEIEVKTTIRRVFELQQVVSLWGRDQVVIRILNPEVATN